MSSSNHHKLPVFIYYLLDSPGQIPLLDILLTLCEGEFKGKFRVKIVNLNKCVGNMITIRIIYGRSKIISNTITICI